MSEARLQALAALVPAERGLTVDVGAHHGHLAARLGALASEVRVACLGRRDVPWVVCDGLKGLRAVDVAICAGMGARTIARIVAEGPTPRVLITHADDDPALARQLLAAQGWRLEAEALAPQRRRMAELGRWVRGAEPATGPWLEHGPRLLAGDDPHLIAHLDERVAHYEALARAVGVARPDTAADFAATAAFLRARLAEARLRRGEAPP